MLDSILDHRLQDQTGNLRGQQIRGNTHAKLKAFGKARLLNVEIFPREFQFFGQRNLMAFGLAEKLLRNEGAFSKYRGIGNAGILSGRKSIRKWCVA